MSNRNEVITYYNLTQCADGDMGKRFVYFRSTDVEQKNYERLLWGVPDEWLYFLSLGKQIKVIDKSSNGTGKIERIFIPVLNDVLSCLYGDGNIYLVIKKFRFNFDLMTDILEDDRLLKGKFYSWLHIIKSPIKILAETIHVDKEPNPL